MGQFQESWVGEGGSLGGGSVHRRGRGGCSRAALLGDQEPELTWVSEGVWITNRQGYGMKTVVTVICKLFYPVSWPSREISNK